MKKIDFDNFKLSLNLSIEIDGHIRSISEKVRLLSQMRDSESMRYVADFLSSTNADIDKLIEEQVCKDE